MKPFLTIQRTADVIPSYHRSPSFRHSLVQEEVVETLTEKVGAAEAVHESLKQDLGTRERQLASVNNEMGALKDSQAGLEQDLQDLSMGNEVLKVRTGQ